MFQATRQRLALWYTGVTAILLLLFATGFYLYVRSTLIERIDDTLSHVVEIVQRSLVVEPNPEFDPANFAPNLNGSAWRVNIDASFPSQAAAVEDDHIDLEWFSPTGELLWSTFSAPIDVPLHPNSEGETVYANVHSEPVRQSQVHQSQAEKQAEKQTEQQAEQKIEQETEEQTEEQTEQQTEHRADLLSYPSFALRQITQRVQKADQVLGYLRVSHPWFEVTKPSRQLIRDLAGGVVLMLGAVAAIGWLLSGLAIAPIRDAYQRLRQFTADASHELRNPIAVIQTNVQVALADPDPALQQDQLQIIERLTRRLGRLVDDLLFLARQDGGTGLQLSPVQLDRLLQDVVEEQQALAVEKKIDLQFQCDAVEAEKGATGYLLNADTDQLTRLFTNLIGNAVQYTPEAGQIQVRLQRRSSGSLQVQVKDNGIGIPADALPHIFERFYRVDPARTAPSYTANSVSSPSGQRDRSGSGLGLAIAKVIAENHHGQIQVVSSLHQGTTFTVTLPYSKNAAAPPASASNANNLHEKQSAQPD